MVRRTWLKRRRHPVFVGGSGRSGTTALGRLIARHPEYALIATEVRFQAELRGLPGLVAGEITLEQFCHRLLGHYYRRDIVDGSTRGMHLIGVDQAAIEQAVETFAAAYPSRPAEAGGQLMKQLFDPIAHTEGASSWVEMTPPNAEFADLLINMLPDCRVIHIVRDGRDVATSVMHHAWGPDDAFTGLRWWEERLRAADAAASRATAPVLVTSFEGIMVTDREEEYDRLLRFLRLRDDPAMREYFTSTLVPERANIGRWEREVSEEDRQAFIDLYEEILQTMSDDGVSCVEPLLTQSTAR